MYSATSDARATRESLENQESYHPAYIGIHTRDESTRVLYVSSGCLQAVGYRPEELVDKRATDFIADQFDVSDYPKIYMRKDNQPGAASASEELGEDDDASAFVMYGNIKSANGTPMFHKITAFKCDNCVIYIGVTYPEIRSWDQKELVVQMLDGAMQKVNMTQERLALADRRSENSTGGRRIGFRARCGSVSLTKAAFVLESPNTACVDNNTNMSNRQMGPLIAFVTDSVNRLVDADTSDLMGYPFLQLVAPEDVLYVSRFFQRLSDTTNVLFDTFSLLQKPYVIEGDVQVADKDNRRVVVECLGGAVQDGVVLLVRKLRTRAAPVLNSLGDYVRPLPRESNDENGYVSLEEILSSDPDTSDAPTWSRPD
ncbi:hypothetical protein H4R20_001009 [Coemansia guatemalensis]|uniref:PAS domain-containing protein n=1 Tax=Coemansia guatemalensis TaxID=2761395 RepID=A0A9W8I572_9FUNG|nr:hypothetical protein H4R20_001009 [Coemansia guatemalensis]